ncbi:carboxymuconolactone decarboxylase family protein [Algibacter agarivorans]|uniref:Carboxymuconolactone decarboxylase family protein n=1 Tax=Algibacter agarivorans TaxID=1109741 RepID=A0ABP9GPB7_9FLAO
MKRLQALNPETTTGKSKELFNGVQSKLGMVPNMMRTMGNSSAVLEGYLNLSGALAKASIGAKMGELIALTVSQENNCDYCLSAHTFIGENLVKIDSTSLQSARIAQNSDKKTQAGLVFAKKLVTTQGRVSDEDVRLVKDAGYTEGEIGEIIAHVALNVFTNYFNNTAKTAIDFPLVSKI